MKPRLSLPLALGLASLIGACGTGDSDDTGTGAAGGDSGAAGTNGAAGTTATAGTNGSAGTNGAAGTVAAAGTFGSAGTNGAAGTTAAAGTFGSAGTTASAGRGGTTGAAGTATAGTSGAAGRGGTTGAAGRGGTTGTAGTTAAGGRGGAAGTGTGGQSSNTICNFASGLNIAWVNFARDVPNPNVNTFRTVFQNTYNAGGRVIRWWFHTNGIATPGYDGSGMPLGLAQSHVDGVKSILSTAASVGVRINISLWSFDMLQPNAMDSSHPNNITYNRALLENDSNRQAYIDRYLTPLVMQLRGTPGLYSYEIFNEPEGMGPRGWTPTRTTQAAIQKTVNWLADAIHNADSGALVTNGSQTFDYCSTGISGKSNWYSDTALRSAGGRQNGTLNFYEVHYYDANESQPAGTALSPFAHPVTYWGLDKRLVIGEFFARTTDGVQTNDLFTNLYNSGYNGAWAWQYNDGDAAVRWPSMQTAIQNVYNAHMAEVSACR
jgi:hypothetical protein